MRGEEDRREERRAEERREEILDSTKDNELTE